MKSDINIDFLKLKSISDQLIDLMLTKHPNCNYTIWINLWMDDTFQIKCVSAINLNDDVIMLREYKWYNNEITYLEEIQNQIKSTN